MTVERRTNYRSRGVNRSRSERWTKRGRKEGREEERKENGMEGSVKRLMSLNAASRELADNEIAAAARDALRKPCH